MDGESLAAGWEVWNEEAGGRVILAFRPDVFDTHAYPAACLPTVTVAPGATPDAPPERRYDSGQWHVALYLEPDVRAREVDAAFSSREAAIDAARDITAQFSAGEIDYRASYQVPRDAYLDALDGLIHADA